MTTVRKYEKAPIVEAVVEVRWEKLREIDEITRLVEQSFQPEFGDFKQRRLLQAELDLDGGSISQEQSLVGYQISKPDGSEIIIVETNKLAFIRPAPYENWEVFVERALGFIAISSDRLEVAEYSRVGVRFANRIDVPVHNIESFDTDDFITIRFDGPRQDLRRVDEFQMRVVKPTVKPGISYALYVATAPSPLSEMKSIALDIDVFTSGILIQNGPELNDVLAQMRDEKNEIFESCITDRARVLFGRVLQ